MVKFSTNSIVKLGQNKKLSGFLLLFLSVFLFLLIPHIAFAQIDPGLGFGDKIGLGTSDPRVIAVNLIRIALGFLSLITVVLIIYAGFIWASSGGDEQKINQAKRIITNAAIGLIIILSAFGITSFLLTKLIGSLSGGPGPGPGPGQTPRGIGALGSCAIQSVYPEPSQRDVPRNTSIILTFAQAIDPTTICGDAAIYGGDGDGHCDPGEYIIDEHVRIFQTNQDDGCPSPCNGNVLNVDVVTNDNQTFTFTPRDYLGSPSELIWYTVYLSNDIANTSGEPLFKDCFQKYFSWQFEVSNRLDLTPPRVIKSGGVFPPPDDLEDDYATVAGVVATGQLTVGGTGPATYQAASVTSVTRSPAVAAWSDATATAYNSNCGANGTLTATVDSTDMSIALNQGTILLGVGAISSNRANFGYCGLEITLSTGNFSDATNCQSANCQWAIQVTPMVPADTLEVGNITYSFVTAAPTGNQIISAGVAGTAANIITALASHPQVSAVAGGALGQVNITARVAGNAGNLISLISHSSNITVNSLMSGGSNTVSNPIINDMGDKPRNVIVQLNFNESMNPWTISGDAGDLSGFIRIVNATTSPVVSGGACRSDADCVSFDCDDATGLCQGANTYLPGKWEISNIYRTVEFVSNNQCGVNGCGDQIFCLPAKSHLRVELNAANLISCPASVNCSTKSPYNICNAGAGVCETATGENYPSSVLPPDGAVDLAMNSLDGDRSDEAEGPSASNWDENSSSGDGDNFQWSFFINSRIDLSPPSITTVSPPHASSSVSLALPIQIDFNKVMMSSSLKPGTMTTYNGREKTEHKAINFWNFANLPIGYWVATVNVDNAPMDGEPDWTRAEIRHSLLGDTVSYRVQVGSGVRDIYQNCYKPASGPGCTGTDLNPSCCPAGAAINPAVVPEGANCP